MFDKVTKKEKDKSETIYITIAVVSFLSGVIVKVIYRNFIYSNNINDLGLADFLPGFLFVLGITNLALFTTSKINIKNIFRLTISIMIGTLLYEIEQVFRSGVFDIKDVLGILAGALMSYYIFYKLELKRNTIK